MAENKDSTKKPDTPPGAAPAATPEAKPIPPIVLKIKAVIIATITFVKKIIKSPLILNTKAKIQNFGVMGWLKVLTVFTVGFLTYGVYKTAPQWKKLWSLPYESSLESVADQKFNYEPSAKMIKYSNDLLAPQHFVLINKIVVNILPSRLSTKNPMIAFDLYVRTDTEAAAIEIKQREKQIQDHIQRFCESLSYDQIQSEEGKETWKNRMKRELNLVITTGRVKEVLFKTLVIKP